MLEDPKGPRFSVADMNHDEGLGAFHDLPAAMAFVRELSKAPWGEPPLKPPCMEWETCSLDIEISEVNGWGETFESIRWIRVLEVAPGEARWHIDPAEVPAKGWRSGSWWAPGEPVS